MKEVGIHPRRLIKDQCRINQKGNFRKIEHASILRVKIIIPTKKNLDEELVNSGDEHLGKFDGTLRHL